MFPEEAFPEAIKKLKSKGLVAIDDREIRLTVAVDLWRYDSVGEFCGL